jgi:Protein of unknown function (DUF433)
MTVLDEVSQLWPRLSLAEKAQLLQWAARDVGEAFPGIESRPGVCGGEPCIIRTRIPVWVLEQAIARESFKRMTRPSSICFRYAASDLFPSVNFSINSSFTDTLGA